MKRKGLATCSLWLSLNPRNVAAVKVTSRYGEAFSFFNGRLGDYEPFPLSFGHLLPQGGTIQRFKKLESAQQILRNT